MSIESRLLGLFKGEGSRELRLSESRYDQTQHELCLSIAQMIWGEKGLVESLGHTWNMVFDPRFSACERVWVKTQRVTATERDTTIGLISVGDDGSVSTSRMISLEQYAEILGESRNYIGVVNKRKDHLEDIYRVREDLTQVKNWSDEDLLELIKEQCPNYFTQKGEPNPLALIWVKMFKEDILGLVNDYSPVSGISSWVTVEGGDIVHDPSKHDPHIPIAHAEIEYLDRALLYREVLRANVVKVLEKIGGQKLKNHIKGIVLTDFEKDMILQIVFSFKYDELYRALPGVLKIFELAKANTHDARLEEIQKRLRENSQRSVKDILSGAKPLLDLSDGDSQQEQDSFSKIQHNENLVALFYMLVQADEMVKGYPGFQAIIDLLSPIIEAAEEPEDFEGLCVKIQDLADAAIMDKSVSDDQTPEVIEENR